MHEPITDDRSKTQLPPRPPPQAPARAPTPDPEALRRWALSRPDVLHLGAELAPASDPASEDRGLAWEARPAPALVGQGSMRVSVVQILSSTSRGTRIVGQVQACCPVDHPLARPELAWVLHHPDHGHPRRFHGPEAWFIGVLDAHYARGGPPIAASKRAGAPTL